MLLVPLKRKGNTYSLLSTQSCTTNAQNVSLYTHTQCQSSSHCLLYSNRHRAEKCRGSSGANGLRGRSRDSGRTVNGSHVHLPSEFVGPKRFSSHSGFNIEFLSSELQINFLDSSERCAEFKKKKSMGKTVIHILVPRDSHSVCSQDKYKIK